MGNRDIEAALDYHEATKHSERSRRATHHALDWGNKPLPFKIYWDLEPIPLTNDFPARDAPALTAISGGPDPSAESGENLADPQPRQL